MYFIKNVSDEELQQWLVSSVNQKAFVRIYIDNYLSMLGASSEILNDHLTNEDDDGTGIATTYGAVKFSDLATAINNGEGNVTCYGKTQNQEVDVNIIVDSIRTSRSEAQTVGAGLMALREALETDQLPTAASVNAYFTQLGGNLDLPVSNLSVVTSILVNAKTNIVNKLQQIVGCLVPATDPTDFNSIGSNGSYDFGTPWQAFSTLINWDWSSVWNAVSNFYTFQFKTMFFLSSTLFKALANAFYGFGNWVSMKIAGKKFERMNDDNSLPDSGGFTFRLKCDPSEMGFLSPELYDDGILEELDQKFQDGYGFQFYVPGGILLWTGIDFDIESIDRYIMCQFRFIPENQAGLIPSFDNRPETPDYPWIHCKYSDDWTLGEGGPTSPADNFGDDIQTQLNRFTVADIFSKTTPAWLDLSNATDYTQWCSSYRMSLWLFVHAFNNLWSHNTSDYNPEIPLFSERTGLSASDFKRTITAITDKDDIMGPFGLDGNLGYITSSTSNNIIDSYEIDHNTSHRFFAKGLTNMLYVWKYNYFNFPDAKYAWPVWSEISQLPDFGIHIATSDEMRQQLSNMFTNAGKIILATVAVVGAVKVFTSLKKTAFAAQAAADTFIFSEEYDGSPAAIAKARKLQLKATLLNKVTGVAGSAVSAKDTTLQEIKTIITGL